MTNTHLPNRFDERVLTAISAPVNHENMRLFNSWRRTEGGNARWNPLNSTLWVEGWTALPNYNEMGGGLGVRNYKYEFAGIAATILTFASREPNETMRYGGIVGDLQYGTKTAPQIVTSRSTEFERWGTDIDLLLQVLRETP